MTENKLKVYEVDIENLYIKVFTGAKVMKVVELSTLTTAVKDTLNEIEDRIDIYKEFRFNPKTTKPSKQVYSDFQCALKEATQIIKKNLEVK